MAITLTLIRPVTDEELLELSRLNPGYQFERDVRGGAYRDAHLGVRINVTLTLAWPSMC